MMIPSLKKLSIICFCDQLNSKIEISSKELTAILSLNGDLMELIFPFLHYRFLNQIAKMQPNLISKIEPFYQPAMRKEEDFQRTQTAVNIPLISTSAEFSTFKRKSFPFERLCLDRTKPYTEWHHFERQNFDWNYLDHLSNSIVTIEEFKENWAIFTMNQLEKMNWKNVFAAGGSVSACIRPIPEEYKGDKRYEFLHEIGFETSDIDLFIYGLSPEESREKLIEIYRAIRSLDSKVYANSNTITFVRRFPYRCIQVVISNFQYPSEILANLDIDYVCFGYDGNDVYCLPKAREAVNTGVSIINTDLKRISYRRLDKWQSRGVQFGIPNFITVPFGQKEKNQRKLLMLLAISKMNLLHQYRIQLDWSNAVRKWEVEYAYGYSIDSRNRGIDKSLRYDDYFQIKHQMHPSFDDDDPLFNWDCSFGIMGHGYTKMHTFIDIFPQIVTTVSEDELREKWKLNGEKWTWEGAPEFRDWTYKAKQRVESARLQMVPFKREFSIPKLTNQESFSATFQDSLQNKWTLHFASVLKGLEISLELLNASEEYVPLIAVYLLKSSSMQIHYDITHLFASSQPKSMGIIIFHDLVEQLTQENYLKITIDMRVMEQELLCL